jgi:hypothetical protein
MPCRVCRGAVAASGAYSKVCRTCWKARNASRRGWCYILVFPGTGVCKVGHTTDMGCRLRSYSAATRVVWQQDGPLDACRESEARIKAETASALAHQIPWAFAARPDRTRRGRPAFSGETELRAARTDADVEVLRLRYASIFAETTENAPLPTMSE